MQVQVLVHKELVLGHMDVGLVLKSVRNRIKIQILLKRIEF